MVPHNRIIEISPNGYLTKDNRHRLERVLRLRVGDTFVITNGCGKEAVATLQKDGQYSVSDWVEPQREPKVEVTLFVALSKGDRLEWIIEKAVEMGVTKIVPLISERCIVKDPNKNKIERWQKIAESAMIQCGGCILPELSQPIELTKIPLPGQDVLPLFLYEENLNYSIDGLKSFSDKYTNVWLVSGPEGGFTSEEVEFFKNNNWKTIWLGKRLFRMDTAPIVALANILAPYWL